MDADVIYLIFIVFLGTTLFLYFLFDFHYFVRLFLTICFISFWHNKISILQETKLFGICLPTDVDILLNHMNNARFIRELDFAKTDFYQRTGLLKALRKNGGSILIGATTIRYRRLLKIFSIYYITTKILYWDEKYAYIEHRFISNSDNFINAIAISRIRFISCSGEKVFTDLLNDDCFKEKPSISPKLVKWIESNDICSNTLRNSYNFNDSVIHL